MSDELSVFTYEHTNINQKIGDGPPVYVIRFKHWEMPPEDFGTNITRFAGVIVVCFGGLAGLFAVAGWGQTSGIGWVVPVLLWIGLVVYCFKKLIPPWEYKRAIEIDHGANLLRLYRNGKHEQDFPLSHFTTFTVEPHPDAEHARENRMMNNKKEYSHEEKQHCLFGFYGPGGGGKALLVARHEWPNKNTLSEVRAAIVWAIGEGKQAEGHGPETGGTKPPLD